MTHQTKKTHHFEILMKIEMDGQTVQLENYAFDTPEGTQSYEIQEFISRFIRPFTEAEIKRLEREKRQQLDSKFKNNESL